LSRSKRSSASPPEFFADRCLGRRAPDLLVEAGWIVHVIGDHFPDDAANVGDPEWVEYGLRRNWSLLTQDERISTQPAVRELLSRYRGCVHCLDSANLSAAAKAGRFEAHRRSIHQHVLDRRMGFFVVHEVGVPRRKRMA
jgi:hypothetical protein